jgi:hypothetical protein
MHIVAVEHDSSARQKEFPAAPNAHCLADRAVSKFDAVHCHGVPIDRESFPLDILRRVARRGV